MTLGHRLKAARKRKKMTQEEVANKLGIDFTTVSKHENDKNEPDNETLQQYATIYEEDAGYLLTGNRNNLQHEKQDATSEDQKFLVSLATLKQIRDQIARGEVEDIPADRIPFILDDLDTEIEIIERKYRDENKEGEQK